MNREEYYMKMTLLAAERSTCRVKVGAIAVKDKRVIMTAYNGAPSGMKHCTDVGCHNIMATVEIPVFIDTGKARFRNGSEERSTMHCNRTIHAEQNIITQCAKHGVNLSNAIIYTTHQPCFECVKLLYASGVKKIIYKNDYIDERFIDEYYDLNIMHKYGEL